MEIERRKNPREKPDHLIYVEFGRDNGGMMRDFSECGLGFRAVGPVLQGEKVQFAFSFGAGKELTGEAELIWTDAEGRAGGLRFRDANGELRAQIRDGLALEGKPATPEAQEVNAAAMPRNTLEELRQELRGEAAPPAAVPVVWKRVPGVAPAIALAAAAAQAGEQRQEAAAAILPVAKHEWKPEAPAESAALEEEIRVAPEPLGSLEEEMAGTKWLDNVTLGWAVGAMLVLTVLAVSFVYHREAGQSLIWLGEIIAGDEKPAEAPTPKRTSPEPVSGTDGATNQAKPRETETAKPAAPPAETDGSQPVGIVTEVQVTADQDSNNVAAAAAAAKSEGTGQREFQQALQILRGKGPSSELPEAVRLLWIAVEKGNSGAEVALADLYRRGEGVTQNCDQTRVLLAAAAKKGNSEAKNRLAELEQSGCP